MIDDVGDGWATPETARRARETRELDDSTLSLSQRRLNYGDASDGPSDEELEYGGHGFGSSLVESMVESAKAPTLSRGVHLCAVLAASVARCDLVSACYAGCFLTLSGSTRPTAKDIARSKRTSWMSLLIGLAFIAAQVQGMTEAERAALADRLLDCFKDDEAALASSLTSTLGISQSLSCLSGVRKSPAADAGKAALHEMPVRR